LASCLDPGLRHGNEVQTYSGRINKVPAQVRKRFKLAAIHAGITQNELVQRMLAAWEAQHPTR
jgi:hypothetical protein